MVKISAQSEHLSFFWIRIRIRTDLDPGGKSYADPDPKHWTEVQYQSIGSLNNNACVGMFTGTYYEKFACRSFSKYAYAIVTPTATVGLLRWYLEAVSMSIKTFVWKLLLFIKMAKMYWIFSNMPTAALRTKMRRQLW